MPEFASKIELVMDSVLSRLKSGALRAGDRLRSVREEAGLLGVAKNTVVEAYLRLVAQGVLTTRPGSGYFVSRVAQRPKTPAVSSIPATIRPSSVLMEQLERNLPIRPGDGRLPSDWLESAEMRRPISVMRVSAEDTYNTAWGLLPLRERLCNALAEPSIQCDPAASVATVHGLEQAGFSVPRPLGGGYYVWVQLPASMQRKDLAAQAADAGIFIAPSAVFATSDSPSPGMRINVAHGSHPTFLSWLKTVREG